MTQRNYHSHENREEEPKPVAIYEKPSFWVAWQPIISVFLLLTGGLAWGLKLEARIDALTSQVQEMRAEVAKGILPVTEERIRGMAERIEIIRSQQILNIQGLQDLREDINKMSNEVYKFSSQLNKREGKGN